MVPLVVYVPAIHAGYLALFEKYERIYILGDDVLEKTSRFKYLERDLRRFDAETVQKLLQTLYPEKEVSVATENALRSISEEVAMPEDEISREIADAYFLKNTVFEPIFLRWSKEFATKEASVQKERTISRESFDTEMMAHAQELTTKSSDWWRQIGAVIVKDGAVVVEAYNKRLPTEYTQDAYGDPRSNFDAGKYIELASTIHSESFAIAHAAKKGIPLDGASMYVTTFPCPVCAKSIAMAGIKKLYYRDGYSLLDAEKILTMFGVEIIQVKDS